MDTVVGVIFPLLTVVIGAACILLFTSLKTLRDSRDDLSKRVDFLEAENDRQVKHIATQDAELEVWRKAVTGEAYLVAISNVQDHVLDVVVKHHEQASEQWARMGKVMEHMDSMLTKMAEKP